jgi:hypothetical protein
MNARWHREHPMPKHPSERVRVKWHVAHAKACACREIPDSIAALIRRFDTPRPNGRESRSTRS